MTTRPEDGTVFAILRGRDDLDERATFLCTIDVETAEATNIGQTDELVDGLTWVPSDYFVD